MFLFLELFGELFRILVRKAVDEAVRIALCLELGDGSLVFCVGTTLAGGVDANDDGGRSGLRCNTTSVLKHEIIQLLDLAILNSLQIALRREGFTDSARDELPLAVGILVGTIDIVDEVVVPRVPDEVIDAVAHLCNHLLDIALNRIPIELAEDADAITRRDFSLLLASHISGELSKGCTVERLNITHLALEFLNEHLMNLVIALTSGELDASDDFIVALANVGFSEGTMNVDSALADEVPVATDDGQEANCFLDTNIFFQSAVLFAEVEIERHGLPLLRFNDGDLRVRILRQRILQSGGDLINTDDLSAARMDTELLRKTFVLSGHFK